MKFIHSNNNKEIFQQKMNNIEVSADTFFSGIYNVYFPKMVRFAQEYIISEEDSKNIVQDLFMYLWEHSEILESVSNLNAFLFTLIKNRCIDFYRSSVRINARKRSLSDIQERELHLKMEALQQFDTINFFENEVEELLEKAIEKLPEKCRQVFIMSRMDGMKHEEIARELKISVYTVQNHISSAIRKLKAELKDYLPVFLFIFGEFY